MIMILALVYQVLIVLVGIREKGLTVYLTEKLFGDLSGNLYEWTTYNDANGKASPGDV